MKKNRILCLMASLTILGFIITGTPFIYGEDVILDRMNSLSYLTFIPKTSQLVSHCGSEPNGSIRFWSLVDGKLDEVISLDKKQYARPLAVSHDGSLIVIHLLLSDRLDCYSIKERKWLWKTKLSWFRDSPEDIAFTTDDGKIIAAGLRNIVALDSKNGTVLEREEKPLNDYPNFYYVPKRVFLSPSGRYLVAWQEFPLGTQGRGWTHLIVNKWVTIWDIEKKTTVGRWQKPDAGLWSAAFSHNDKEVVMGSRDGYVWVTVNLFCLTYGNFQQRKSFRAESFGRCVPSTTNYL